MECPYCKAALVHWDSFSKTDKSEELGHLLICPTDTCGNPCDNTFHKYHGTETLKEGLPG